MYLHIHIYRSRRHWKMCSSCSWYQNLPSRNLRLDEWLAASWPWQHGIQLLKARLLGPKILDLLIRRYYIYTYHPCVHSAGWLCPLQTQPYTTKCCLNLNQPPLLHFFFVFWWWIKSQCGPLQNGYANGFAVKNHDSLLKGFWKFHSKSLVYFPGPRS